MKMSELLRKALSPRRSAATPNGLRCADEKRDVEAAKAWKRQGGPIDPGFVA